VVIGVLVTYEPDPATLGVLLRALRPQLEKVIVVDNGSGFDTESNINPELRSDAWCQVVRLHSNLGIAAAQNVGIGLARKPSVSSFGDQDSEPAPDMVSRLLDVATAKSSTGVAVAAIGPRYTDKRQDNPPPFIRIQGVSVKRQACRNTHSVVEVDYLIASGSLIPMTTLDAVGGIAKTCLSITWILNGDCAPKKLVFNRLVSAVQ
jgi:rhamnosyltransferase